MQYARPRVPRLGTFEHQYGNGSSPVLYGDLAILWCGPNEGKGRNW